MEKGDFEKEIIFSKFRVAKIYTNLILVDDCYITIYRTPKVDKIIEKYGFDNFFRIENSKSFLGAKGFNPIRVYPTINTTPRRKKFENIEWEYEPEDLEKFKDWKNLGTLY